MGVSSSQFLAEFLWPSPSGLLFLMQPDLFFQEIPPQPPRGSNDGGSKRPFLKAFLKAPILHGHHYTYVFMKFMYIYCVFYT
jgi:hypothetical protein